jgi:RimJ/RimL family protein N-acetyltransferase
MNVARLQTKSLTLVSVTKAETLAMLEAMSPEELAEVSAAWLAQLHASAMHDPWTHGFSLEHRDTGAVIGNAAFKGPPTVDGVVEIAYGIDPDYQGKGYATEAADALTAFALASGRVRTVCAHTLPEANASTRVLTKCGFTFVGETIDPEDGLVWRWEKRGKEPS